MSCLMLQGSGSNAGKTFLTALLARALYHHGMSVVPFKPQNMSNNAFVTKEGKEIGRAQALQAFAANVEAHHDMNPILLKPEADGYAQLIVGGTASRRVTAKEYHALKKSLMPTVLAAFHRLQKNHDAVLIEGAGSPAEINLRKHDIANMGFACAVQAPVLLISDMERGGAFAAIAGCHQLFSSSERQLLKGYILNQMRGDVSLLDGAMAELKNHVPLDCWGIVPHFERARYLPAEDSLALTQQNTHPKGALRIAIMRLPHIANSDDFDPLIHDDALDCRFVEHGDAIGDVDGIILPGSKAVCADLRYVWSSGWAYDILAAARRGKVILGLCGGYQMLGDAIDDPLAIEGKKDSVTGLGLLHCRTTLHQDKTLIQHHTTVLQGYEIHHGITQGDDCHRPLLVDNTPISSSATSRDGRISGCYLHGYFHNDAARIAWLKSINPHYTSEHLHYVATDTILDELSQQLTTHIAFDGIISLLQENKRSSSERLSS